MWQSVLKYPVLSCFLQTFPKSLLIFPSTLTLLDSHPIHPTHTWRFLKLPPPSDSVPGWKMPMSQPLDYAAILPNRAWKNVKSKWPGFTDFLSFFGLYRCENIQGVPKKWCIAILLGFPLKLFIKSSFSLASEHIATLTIKLPLWRSWLVCKELWSEPSWLWHVGHPEGQGVLHQTPDAFSPQDSTGPGGCLSRG